jgi:hypothetical protein
MLVSQAVVLIVPARHGLEMMLKLIVACYDESRADLLDDAVTIARDALDLE